MSKEYIASTGRNEDTMLGIGPSPEQAFDKLQEHWNWHHGGEPLELNSVTIFEVTRKGKPKLSIDWGTID